MTDISWEAAELARTLDALEVAPAPVVGEAVVDVLQAGRRLLRKLAGTDEGPPAGPPPTPAPLPVEPAPKPALAERPRKVAAGLVPAVARKAAIPSPTGQFCSDCGGILVRRGTCLTCADCAKSEGCS